MKTLGWAAGVGVVLLMVALLIYRLGRVPDPVAPPAVLQEEAPAQEVPPSPGPVPAEVPAPTEDAAQAVVPVPTPDTSYPEGVLVPGTDEFHEHIASKIPLALIKLSAQKCYSAEEHRDARLRVIYKVSIKGGQVRFHDAKVTKSTYKSALVEQCILNTVRDTVLDMPNMPDWEETAETAVTSRGMYKFVRPEDGPIPENDQMPDLIEAPAPTAPGRQD